MKCPKCEEEAVPMCEYVPFHLIGRVKIWWWHKCPSCRWESEPGWGATQREADIDAALPGNARLLDGTKVTVPDQVLP